MILTPNGRGFDDVTDVHFCCLTLRHRKRPDFDPWKRFARKTGPDCSARKFVQKNRRPESICIWRELTSGGDWRPGTMISLNQIQFGTQFWKRDSDKLKTGNKIGKENLCLKWRHKSNFKSPISWNKQHMFQDLTNNFLVLKLTSFLWTNVGKSPKTKVSNH